MAKDVRAVCRICRTEGKKLFLKGDRCFKASCAFERKPYWAGMHGKTKAGHRKVSEYGVQLREKQKLKKTYGMLERQFRRYFSTALKSPGVTGTKLLQLLESRLDNVVFRMGFAHSRKHARQMVLHGHVRVDGKRISIPSYEVVAGNTVAVPDKSSWHNRCKEVISLASSRGAIPDWIKVDADRVVGTFLKLPDRAQLPEDINERQIVELYSR
jgi:small subunit ribosomal protein S4